MGRLLRRLVGLVPRCCAGCCIGAERPYSSHPVDPITHTLLGASVSYLACGRRLGRTAAAAGALAAFIPDADIFIRSASDPLLAIEHHRGFTHALAFAPIGSALVASLWLVRPAWRPRWRELWFGCWLAYTSHCLLDAATSYGTRLWWPFSDHREGWDLISIIDPVFTGALAAGVALALRRRLRWPVAIALALAGGYLGWGGLLRARAAAAQHELAVARGHRPARIEVMPTLANNLVWRALYLHDGRIYSDRIRVGWMAGAAVREGWSLPRVGAGDLTPGESARNGRSRSFERFEWFSDGWVARDPAHLAVLGDMRYSLSSEAFDPIWGIRFTQPDAVTPVAWVNRTRDRRIDFLEMWRDVIGTDARYRPLPGVEPAATKDPG